MLLVQSSKGLSCGGGFIDNEFTGIEFFDKDGRMILEAGYIKGKEVTSSPWRMAKGSSVSSRNSIEMKVRGLA